MVITNENCEIWFFSSSSSNNNGFRLNKVVGSSYDRHQKGWNVFYSYRKTFIVWENLIMQFHLKFSANLSEPRGDSREDSECILLNKATIHFIYNVILLDIWGRRKLTS